MSKQLDDEDFDLDAMDREKDLVIAALAAVVGVAIIAAIMSYWS